MRTFLSLLFFAASLAAQINLPAGQNVPFRFAGRSVPQLLNGINGFRFTLPENTVYAAVRLQTITPDVNIQLLVRRGQDVAGTANAPVFGAGDESERPNKQVQIGLRGDLLIGSDQPYFVALRAAESSAPVAGVLRLEVQTMTPGGTRVEISGFQLIVLAGQPDGTRFGNDFSAPLNSPPEPIAVTGGQGFRFQATGNSFQTYDGISVGPEGDRRTLARVTGFLSNGFGTSGISAPPGSLVGFFAGPAIRPADEPLSLVFTSEVQQLSVIRPRLQQVFLIGSGLNSAGQSKSFTAPAGATRLYLGRTHPSPSGQGRTTVRVESSPPASIGPANPLRVSASGYIYLAGQPDGARAGSVGTAPTYSPAQVAVSLVAGQALVFRAIGQASESCSGTINGPNGNPTLCFPPRGSYGLSGAGTRPGSLVGVFLANSVNANEAPATINFSGPIANVTPLRPLLQQIFLIGDGKTEEGADRRVVVPAGATRLFVGQVHGGEWEIGSFTVAVTAERPDRPTYSKTSIVNAASFGAGPLSAGSIVSIFGEQLGQQASASAVPLPRTLGGTQVFFDTIPAPLYIVTPGQINAQVPWELGAAKSAIVTVVRNGIPGPPTEVDLAPYQPALFTAANIGAILVNSRTGGLVTPQDPARAGDVLVGYATGLGATSSDPRTGEPDAGSPLANVASPTRILLAGPDGEREVAPFFTGLAPGFIGVFQLNFALPAGLGAGTARMRLDSAPFGQSPAVDVAVGQ